MVQCCIDSVRSLFGQIQAKMYLRRFYCRRGCFCKCLICIGPENRPSPTIHFQVQTCVVSFREGFPTQLHLFSTELFSQVLCCGPSGGEGGMSYPIHDPWWKRLTSNPWSGWIYPPDPRMLARKPIRMTAYFCL